MKKWALKARKEAVEEYTQSLTTEHIDESIGEYLSLYRIWEEEGKDAAGWEVSCIVRVSCIEVGKQLGLTRVLNMFEKWWASRCSHVSFCNAISGHVEGVLVFVSKQPRLGRVLKSSGISP